MPPAKRVIMTLVALLYGSYPMSVMSSYCLIGNYPWVVPLFCDRMDGGRSFAPDGEKAERGHGRFPALGQEWLTLEGGHGYNREKEW